MSASADLLDFYRTTHYDVRMPGGERITLHVGQHPHISVVEWTDDDWPLACIGAANPHSMELSAAENRQRSRTLLDRFVSKPARTLAGVGHIPAQGWREPFLLVAGLTIKQIDSLAIEFGQNAVVIAHRSSQVRLRIYRKEWNSLLDQIDDVEAADKSG